MARDEGCPDVHELQQLVLGQVSDLQALRLEDHLARCSQCSGTLHALEAEDTLVQAVRGGGGCAPDPEKDIVESLMVSLKRMSPAGASAGEDFLALLAQPQAPDELGRLGSYRVLEVLGAGGMGIVFKAEDPDLNRLVAVKVMRPNLAVLPEARERFLREASAAAALNHEHIVGIHHVALERGIPFLVMPLLEGETLERRLRREAPLPVMEVVSIGRQIADGLAAAHNRGLIHRDIKPANIWLETRGEGRWPRGEGRDASEERRGATAAAKTDVVRETTVENAKGEASRLTRPLPLASHPSPLAPHPSPLVKILDFGLVREQESTARITQTGVVVGTPEYMAPEQAAGKPVDARSDLFSLGCVLYHLATGMVPFKGPDTMATLFALANSQPVSPARLDANVPPALSDLIMRLLARSPEDRPASARHVADALRDLETSGARPGLNRGKRLAAWSLSAAALVLLAGTLVLQLRTSQGTLEIQLSEPDAVVKVLNEKDVVEISRSGGRGAVTIAVEPGKHRLRIEKDGFKFFTQDFTVEAGKTVVLSAKLVPDVRGEGREARDKKKEANKPLVFHRASPVYQIAYAHNAGGDFDIYLMNPDGSGQVNLTRHSARDVMPAWSPDGKRIAFASTRDGPLNLYVMNADGSAVRRLTDSQASDRWPSWSPDGKRIAFDRREGSTSGIFLLDVGSSPAADPVLIQEDAVDPAWSPDGRQIAFASHRAGKGLRLYVMDHEGGNVRMLSQRDNPRHSTFPAWSPDGKKIAYGDFVNGSVEVFSLDPATGKSTQITRFSDSTRGLTSAAAWSPDGKRLALVRQLLDRNENTLYVMDADGSNAQPILVERRDMTDRPAWRPLAR